MIISDTTLIPPGREYWTSPEMVKNVARGIRPTFSGDEVGKIFFGTSANWVRQYLREGYLVDGKPFEVGRTPGGHQAFTLYDVEVWAHALAREQVITGQQLEYAVRVVRDIARVHRFIA